MKKITLLAVAALMASSAMADNSEVTSVRLLPVNADRPEVAAFSTLSDPAALPAALPAATKVKKIEPVKSARKTAVMQSAPQISKMQRIEKMQQSALSSVALRSEVRYSEAEATNGDPIYCTPGSFYLTISNQYYGGYNPVTMIAPSRGTTKFVPLATYTNSTWDWSEYEYDSDTAGWVAVPYTATTDTLEYANFPNAQTASFMTLTATNDAGETVSYCNPNAGSILCGRNFNDWGGYDADTYGTFGVSTVPTGITQSSWYIWGAIFGFDKSSSTQSSYNQYGVSTTVANNFTRNNELVDPSSVKLKYYTTEIPSPGAPYQLGSLYFLCRSVNSEDYTITVTAYEVDEATNQILPTIVGKGSAVISANSASSPFYEFLTVELNSVNVLGYKTNQPICTDKGLYFEITGMDADCVESFYMMVNGNEVVTSEEWNNQTYWRKVYAGYGNAVFSMSEVNSYKTFDTTYPYVHAYYGDKDGTICIANNFLIGYNIYFPQVYDYFTGKDEFSAELPVEGSDAVYVAGSYDFAQLIADGLMAASTTEKWIGYNIHYLEDYEVTAIEVYAIADCPDGVYGRTGEINFTGYGCDFTVTVTQPAGGKGAPIEYVYGDPIYYTPNSFYLTVSNKYYGGSNPTTMIAPSRGTTKFVPTEEFKYSQWSWEEYEYNNGGWESIPYSAAADTLELKNAPYLQTATFMTLQAVNNNNEGVAYCNPNAGSILCGRNYNEWASADSENYGTFGVSTVPTGNTQSSWYIWGAIFGFDKSESTQSSYNQYGVTTSVANNFTYTNELIDPGSVKLKYYTTEIPSPGAPYQLGSLYFLCRSVNSEDYAITVTAYEVDAETDSILPTIVGKGSAVIPANSASSPSYTFLTVELNSVNSLGETTNLPICTDKGLYFEITGMDADCVESFYMMVNGNEVVPEEEWSASTYWRQVYAGYGHMVFSMNQYYSDKTLAMTYPYTHAYYGDEDGTLRIANNFLIGYNIYFPQVYNYFTGEDTFTADVTEGADYVYVDGSYDFAQLVDDGLIVAEASADWIDYEINYLQDYEITVIEVSALTGCPEELESRTGEINFTGYGCDFTVTVTQDRGGKVGINEVNTTATADAVEYYDLQGRKLSAAPAKGFYIQRTGSTVTKLIK